MASRHVPLADITVIIVPCRVVNPRPKRLAYGVWSILPTSPSRLSFLTFIKQVLFRSRLEVSPFFKSQQTLSEEPKPLSVRLANSTTITPFSSAWLCIHSMTVLCGTAPASISLAPSTAKGCFQRHYRLRLVTTTKPFPGYMGER